MGSKGTTIYSSDSRSHDNKRFAAKKNDTSKLDELISRSSIVIFETKSRFPGMFPKTISICPNRVTVTIRSTFSKEEYPIPIENVVGARLGLGILFGTLNLETFGYKCPDPITYLDKKDARLARRYILALVECKKNNVDLSEYSAKELREKLKKVGTVREGFEKESSHRI